MTQQNSGKEYYIVIDQFSTTTQVLGASTLNRKFLRNAASSVPGMIPHRMYSTYHNTLSYPKR